MFKKILAFVLAGVLLSTNSVAYAVDMESQTTSVVEETIGESVSEDEGSDEIIVEEEVIMEKSLVEEAEDEATLPDERTAEWADIYAQWSENSVALYTNASADYETELAKFPSDYQKLIKELHKVHPNWVFVAVDTGLDWDDVVAGESSETRSLISKGYAKLLLSNAAEDYNASTGTYIPRDGSNWVNASDPAIAYFVDPRNYLNEAYIFAMELQAYDANCHTLEGVESILAGTDLANKTIRYINTDGKIITLDLLTYGKAILAAGAANEISPLVLASKIKQETGAKLTNGSISGIFSYNSVSYKGYYNFYNIGAYATSTGSAVANGLSYAMRSGSYHRPWTSPLLAIHGGAEFLVESYISKGQNTGYFQKFNTVYKPYYSHQYMQNLTAAMSEARTTYNSYKAANALDNSFVFYVPVYDNMPSQTDTITISKNKSTAKTTYTVNMRKGPSTSYGKVMSVPANGTVLISEIVFTDDAATVGNKMLYPYWAKVTYGDTIGYICIEYLNMNTSLTVQKGATQALNLSKSVSGENVYYETSNPAIATVNDKGVITAVGDGTCTIYAITSSGQAMDMIGVKVTQSLTVPVLGKIETTKDTAKVSWTKVEGASGYYVYRKSADGSWTKIATVSDGNIVSYTDTGLDADTTYTYTVKAFSGTAESTYSKEGISGKTLPRTYTTYKTTEKVNYRTGPGTTYSKVGSLAKGTEIQIEDGYSKDANGYTWNRFKYNSKEYYVASAYVTDDLSSGSTSTPTTKTYTTYKTTEKVNYRTGAGTTYTKAGSLAKGTSIQVEDGYSKSANGYTWYRFTYNSKEYYVAAKYLTKATSGSSSGTTTTKTYTTYKTTEKVNYRIGAGTTYTIVGSLAKGAVIQVEDGYSKSANGYTWYRFKYNSKEYYIAAKYLTKQTSSSSTSTTIYTTYKTTERVNYRSGAGTSFNIIGTLAKGASVQVENGYSKSANGYMWYRIKYNSKNYYIVSKYLTK